MRYIVQMVLPIIALVLTLTCITGCPLADGVASGGTKTFFVRLCRGNADYGSNSLVDNGDGTVTDGATGLMWSQADDGGNGMNWEDALAWVQARNAESYLGHDDWRLPNAKELQSIVDYTRSPDTTNSAAIDPVFDATVITNEAGETDYPYYWSGTTHLSANGSAGNAVYVAFGRGLGTYDSINMVDVHGAGCQRGDPKDGDPNDYPQTVGPQGDVRRVFNYVRLVRDAGAGAYPIVDTGQAGFYGGAAGISEPAPGASFYGQDAHFDGNQPSYTLSADGLTVYDNVTGLTWTQTADLDGDGDIDTSDKRTFTQAQTHPDTLNAQNYGGYDDWRVPSIKESYSLIDFRGTDPSVDSSSTSGLTPFIDTTYFAFAYGDTAAGDRVIDSQWVSSTLYVADTGMMFGVNFADGRIKGYGQTMP